MQNSGMSAKDVLIAATRNGAMVLHKDKELGTIEEGKFADLVVFDADPSKDIRNVASVAMVMKNGTLHSKENLLHRLRNIIQ